MGRKGSQRAAGGRGKRSKEEVDQSLLPPDPNPASLEEKLAHHARAELTAKARKYAPDAIDALVEVMKFSEAQSSRVSAARAILGYAYPESSGEGAAGLGGARIQVNILRLSTGELEAIDIQRDLSSTMKALLGRTSPEDDEDERVAEEQPLDE